MYLYIFIQSKDDNEVWTVAAPCDALNNKCQALHAVKVSRWQDVNTISVYQSELLYIFNHVIVIMTFDIDIVEQIFTYAYLY